MAVRAFIAVEIGLPLREELRRVQEELRFQAPISVGWVDPQGIHLTLKFLGDIPEERVAEIGAALDVVASAFTPFPLRLDRCGVFPNASRPRVVWVGVAGDLERLTSLQRSVEEAMGALGFPPEGRPFSPHLTLGRVRDQRGGRWTPETEVAPLEQQVAGLALFQSRLTPRGAVYTRLVECSFSRG